MKIFGLFGNSKVSKGFTLIELLIAVAVIGIISGIALVIIDPGYQNKIAQDGVRASTLAKLALGIETYAAAEAGKYPVDGGNDGNPIEGATDPLRSYLTEWPTINASTKYYYYTSTPSDVSYMCISVPMATVDTLNFKYVAPFGGAVTGDSSCVGKVLKNCPETHDCDAGNRYNISNCVQINDAVCT